MHSMECNQKNINWNVGEARTGASSKTSRRERWSEKETCKVYITTSLQQALKKKEGFYGYDRKGYNRKGNDEIDSFPNSFPASFLSVWGRKKRVSFGWVILASFCVLSGSSQEVKEDGDAKDISEGERKESDERNDGVDALIKRKGQCLPNEMKERERALPFASVIQSSLWCYRKHLCVYDFSSCSLLQYLSLLPHSRLDSRLHSLFERLSSSRREKSLTESFFFSLTRKEDEKETIASFLSSVLLSIDHVCLALSFCWCCCINDRDDWETKCLSVPDNVIWLFASLIEHQHWVCKSPLTSSLYSLFSLFLSFLIPRVYSRGRAI